MTDHVAAAAPEGWPANTFTIGFAVAVTFPLWRTVAVAVGFRLGGVMEPTPGDDAESHGHNQAEDSLARSVRHS